MRIGIEIGREEVQLDGCAGEAGSAVGHGVLEAGAEHVRVVIIDVGSLARHELREDVVQRAEERRAAAEVLLEIDDLADVLRAGLEPSVAVEESAGLGEAEAVDALLDVADAEEV